MERLVKLGQDMALLWTNYHGSFWDGSGYLGGIRNTLILALAATVIGCVIGLVCGILNTIPYTRQDPRGQALFSQADPSLGPDLCGGLPGHPHGPPGGVHLLRPALLHQQRRAQWPSVWAASILVVSINTGAYMAESVRGGIISIDPGQTEGAKAIGMTHVQTMTSVILPQALRNIMPQIGNNFIINIKDTSVMFIISFTEFFAVHRNIMGINIMYFPSAAIEMIGYLCMTLPRLALSCAWWRSGWTARTAMSWYRPTS